MFQRAGKLKDQRALDILQKVLKVHEDIRYDALKTFVDKCVKLHAIAFLQWRLMHPDKSEESKDTVRELILHRMVELYNLDGGCENEEHTHKMPSKAEQRTKTAEQLDAEKKEREVKEIM